MRLWERAWRVQVGTLDVSALDVKFTIKRTLRAQPGTCELEIFNLTSDHRAEVARSTRGQTFVRVDAGYEDGMSTLFQGDVRRVDTRRDGVNWVSKVTGGDGEHAIRSARVTRSFAPGTRVAAVVEALADAMGVGAGNARAALADVAFASEDATAPERGVFADGVVVHGVASRRLEAICASAGFEVSVQGGVLQLLPRGRALARTAIRLAPESGLIASPEVGKSGRAKAKALLIPGIAPGQQVALASDVLSGVYRIDALTATGDTRGEDWGFELELRHVT